MRKRRFISIFILAIALGASWFYNNQFNLKSEETGIIMIESNLGDYRIVPDDPGGLPVYNLDIYE
jgi:hypothetical protein